MGRHERPVDPTAGPVEAFAFALRELRVRAGAPSYRLLSRKAGYSASALSAAASGTVLPSLELALAYVGACGGQLDEWEQRWRRTASAAQPVKTAEAPVIGAAPRLDDRPAPMGVFEQLTPNDPRQAGEYRLRARIGVGSMGTVYLAYTPGGRAIAVKVVRSELSEDPEFRRRFADEVAAGRRVSGLYTAQVLNADPAAARPWLATVYVAGPNLQEAVTECGPLPVSSIWPLIAGLAEALQNVQDAGIVHRDLKPSNVLLAADGPRLIDFGIARASDATRLTRTGIQVGSPQFMAPEHVLGTVLAFPADVFALGALIVYAVTGRAPFGDGVDAAVLYRVVHEPPDLTGLGGDLRSLASACLHKEPGRRPTLGRVIEDCRRHSGQTSLKITSSWLPQCHTAEINRRAAATPPPGT